MYSCGNNPKVDEKSREALKTKITQMEDSISALQKKSSEPLPNLTSIELINRLTAYYSAFPKDDYAADCLSKLHMKFSELNAHEKALEYGDTLLQVFPNYKNKDFILESMASTYDVLIEPRDTSKIRYYYSLLLKEKNLPKEKREDIVNRLKYIDLDFFSYIEMKEKVVSR
ncbi:MAG: hypothetical protein EBR24_08080 [Flavobacteriia bacterium]|nr:hypothetical protein [Flavobacteriia bacterium]